MAKKKAKRLTHVDHTGTARMVDVSSKSKTARTATSVARVALDKQTLRAVTAGGLAKGDVLATARIAGTMAAKKTSELIPLCHPLAITDIEVLTDLDKQGVVITATVKTNDRTGVEMEAMTAASVAALTIYDMCKAMDKSITIESIKLVSKDGGKSGRWRRED